jgi:hypothetical protein
MVEVKNKLKLSSASFGNLPTGADAAFPNPTLVRALYILYLSFIISAATMSVIMSSKERLRHYVVTGTHVSFADHARDRQRKMNRMVTWRFDLVMRCLSFAPGVGLLLLSYGLYDCLPLINKAVVSQRIGFSAFISLLVYGAMAPFPAGRSAG